MSLLYHVTGVENSQELEDFSLQRLRGMIDVGLRRHRGVADLHRSLHEIQSLARENEQMPLKIFITFIFTVIVP